MNRLLRANVRQHGRRYVATGVAVAISMAFILVCLIFSAGLNGSLGRSVTDVYRGAAAVVDVDWDDLTGPESGSESQSGSETIPYPDLSSAVPAVEAVDGVKEVALTTYDYAEVRHGSARLTRQVTLTAPEPFTQWPLRQGSAPAATGEVAVDADTADALGLSVGDALEVGPASSAQTGTPMTVTGILASDAQVSGTQLLMTDEAASRVFPDHSVTRILVSTGETSPSEADQDALSGRVAAALADTPAVSVRPAHEVVDEALQQMKVGSDQMLAILLTFPVIAVVVAGIVVSSTFRVVLHQRRRELALLRCLGARAGQVRGLLVRETLAVGAVSSLVGVAAGALLGPLGVRVLGLADSYREALSSVQPLTVAGVWLLGTLLTLLFGIRPALGVSRVPPIAALQSADEGGAPARSAHRLRLAAGLVLTAGGAAAIWVALRSDDDSLRFLLALAGSMVALVGLLMVATVVMARVTFLIGSLPRGMLARMARANTVRNPDRTGTTATAIIIGVTLIVMMMVGASSTRATLLGEVDARRPLDLIASSTAPEGVPAGVAERIGEIDGVAATADSRSITGTLQVGTDEPTTLAVVGLPDLAPVAHSTVDQPAEGQGFVPESLPEGEASLCRAPDGQSGADDARCLTVELVHNATASDGAVTVSEGTLEELAPNAPVTQVLIKLDEDADLDAVQTGILSLDETLQVSGGAQEREQYTSMIDTVLAVAIGLLAVSVLVSLVGVANTLSLSVAERTRENGLLRALGLTRRQMKAMLVLESLLISVSGTLAGVLLGIGFGWVGVHALPLDLERTIVVVPWWQVAGVGAIAIVCAVVAAWLPGRRAARTSPVEALAAE
jgi:putative ABC transport system permease protein